MKVINFIKSQKEGVLWLTLVGVMTILLVVLYSLNLIK